MSNRETCIGIIIKKVVYCILWGCVAILLGFGASTNAKPLLDDWQLLTSSTVNTVRYHHEAIAMNGYVYIINGQVGYGAYLNSIERAAILPDGTLGQWITMSQSSKKRCYFSAVTVGKWMYLIGGEDGGTGPFRYATVERAEIYPVHGTFSQWTIIRTLPFYIYLHAGVSYKNYIYLLGGFVTVNSDYGYSSHTVFRAEVYPDGSISEFTAETAVMKAAYRREASAIIIGDNLYALGGYDGGYGQSVERAKILPDGHLGGWFSMPSTQYMHIESRCAVAQDTYLLMVAGGGGYFNGRWTTPVEYVTIDTAGNLSPWQLANTTNVGVWGSAAVLAYPYIYLPTGQNTTYGQMITDAVYSRFTPTAIQPSYLWELYN